MMQKQMNFFGKLIFSLVICLLLTLGLVSTTEAQAPTPTVTPVPPVNWADPVRFEENGWFPDIAVDIRGKIHLAWASSISKDTETGEEDTLLNGYDTVLYTTSQDGTQWTAVKDIVAIPMSPGSYVTRPALLPDEMGNLHMIYRIIDMYYTYTRIDTAADVTTWSSPYRISAGNLSYFSRLIKDLNGRMHLVYTENVTSEEDPTLIEFHLFHRYSDDNGQSWSIRSDISSMPLGAAKPQIVLDQDNHLHVTWEAGEGGSLGMVTGSTKLFYSSSHDNGINWSTPFEFPVPANSEGQNITLGVNNKGVLVVAWLNTRDNLVYSQFSTDGGRFWSNPEAIPGINGSWRVYNSHQDGYSMATDNDGIIHLVLPGVMTDGDNTVDILHLSWENFIWSAPDIVADFSGDLPQWPRIAISNGNQLNVTWYVRDEVNLWNTDEGDYHVWFTSGQSFAGYSKPRFWPTETPEPTYTLTPEPTSTVTASPVPPEIIETPIMEDIGKSTYTENDEILIFLRSLLPAVLFLALLFLAIRIFRRR